MILIYVRTCTQVNIVLREGEALEVPDFDDIYASDMVSFPFPSGWAAELFSSTCPPSPFLPPSSLPLSLPLSLPSSLPPFLSPSLPLFTRMKTAMMTNTIVMKRVVLRASEGEQERRSVCLSVCLSA